MNKTELVAQISDAADISKLKAAEALNATIAAIQNALSNGDSVALIGFGTFSIKDRAARTGRNPQTGAPMEIAASKAVNFKAGAGLKSSVNQ